jgi:NAD(P)-dependent dehydrogenase (short-subunit alcohol dehydrogenase family)
LAARDHAALDAAALALCAAHGADVTVHACDLSVRGAAESLAEACGARVDILINNAGAIGHLGPVDDAPADSLLQGLAINLQAPVLLSSVFLKHTRTWHLPRKILNISSGLGRRPMAASALYCAGKAGLDHFTRCLALDEALHANPAKVVSLAPGVIDTDMQTDLRSAKGAGFPDQHMFVQMKNNGALTTPAVAAAHILAYLQRPDFGSNPVADVRDI